MTMSINSRLRSTTEKLITWPLVGDFIRLLLKVKVASFYWREPLKNLWPWLVSSHEITNLTYDLTEQSQLYLAVTIAQITGVRVEQIQKYFRELTTDSALEKHLQQKISKTSLHHWADLEIHYGRRIGWYAFVRALKPKVVVETGVDKGLGACVLASALLRNAKEGFPGRYFGTDIDPQAGLLFSDRYAATGVILYGDSVQSLRKFDQPIDLFINDSDHSANYEAKEYATIANKLSPNGVILGDNAHATDKLLRFSLKQSRRFTFWKEQPKDHWYPGAGIGISYP